jgi:transglutaminase-like putative cysteine protease
MVEVERRPPTRTRRAGGSDWLPALAIVFDVLLVGLVVLPPTWALQTVHLDPLLPFSMLFWVAVIGLIVGTLLAISDAPGGFAHPLALFGGFAGVVYAISRVLPDVVPDETFSERIAELALEVSSWVRIALGGGQSTNNLLFLLLLALVAWVIGYFSAWAVVRERSAWWPVTVGATGLTLILATYPNLYGYMVVQLVASMLLVGRVNQRSREARWSSWGLRRVGSVGGRAFRASVLLAVVLVLLTWVAPTMLASKAFSEQIGHAGRPWEAAQTQFNRLFGGLQAEDQASLSGFSRSLNLHGTFHLGDDPVLRITAPKQMYWRVIVYDQYTGHGWLSTDPLDQRSLPPGSNILRTGDVQRVDLPQQVAVLALRGSYLVGASQPTTFDRPVLAQAYPDGPGSPVDLVAALSIAPVEVGTRYNVVSKISQATASDLRTANTAYSPGIRQRYLVLPTIPERVRQFAEQTAAPESNPYDKAVAIESYLRTLPYTVDLPAPPADRDGVDYFLFDSKTGYCDYFASAMAVMLRSIGIPARVVSGYAPGTVEGDGSFLIKDSDSHTWTEAYFPPFGWIPFEPSGSFPQIGRGAGGKLSAVPTVQPSSQPPPAGSQDQSKVTPTSTPSPTPNPKAPNARTLPPPLAGLDLSQFVPILYGLLALSLILMFAWWLWEKDLFGLPPTVVAYVKMTRLASILGFGFRTAETPTEYGAALSARLPEARSQSGQIADDYARYRFGNQRSDSADYPLRLWTLVRNALLRRLGRLRRG